MKIKQERKSLSKHANAQTSFQKKNQINNTNRINYCSQLTVNFDEK